MSNMFCPHEAMPSHVLPVFLFSSEAYVLQQMGKVLLIGLWDLLTTSAQCMEPDRFTDAYLDGGGNVRTGLV